MKEKKNIILLIFAVVFFLVALIFCVFCFKPHNDIGMTNINSDVNINENENENKNNNISNENISNENISNEGDNNEISQLKNEIKDELEKKEENANTILEEISNTENIENVSYNDIKVYKEDSSEFNLSEIANSSAMILFWNPEDEASVDVLKKVENVYKKYENRIKFLMISTSKEIPSNLKNEISMEIYYDLDREYEKKYNVTSLPAMIYIYSDNTVMNAKSGVPSTDSLEANLDILSDNI